MKLQTGRIIEVQRALSTVQLDDSSVVYATVRGQFHETGDFPKVGDLVDVRLLDESEEAQAVVETIHPRRSVIERYDEVNDATQILVANVDLIFIVMGLDGDYSERRLERYLALARQSGIAAVVVLNKADEATDLDGQVAAVRAIAGDVPVVVTEASRGAGLAELAQHITSDTTAVLLGSSGVGKSTITNWLLREERQAVSGVRADDSRGRHTTTTRQLFTLPGGGYLIDTPGMRELALNSSDETTHSGFVEIDRLAAECKFRNCDHEKSAGCAVLAAVEVGELSAATLRNYHKMQREAEWQADKSRTGRHAEQVVKRGAQARAAQERKRLSRG